MVYFLIGVLTYLPLLLLDHYLNDVPLFLLLVALSFLFLGISYHAAKKQRFSLPWILATAIVLRIFFIPQPPTLSNDAYRYLWDGMVSAQGMSPYPVAPENLPDMQKSHPELYSQMGHRDRNSIYPSLAQVFFLLNYRLWGVSLVGWKSLLLIAELIMFWLFAKRLRTPPQDFVLWALHPLVILEFYSSAHLDLLALVFLLGCFGVSNKLSAGLLAAATLIKIFPAFLLPIFLRQAKNKLAYGAFWIIFTSATVSLLLFAFGSPWESVTSFLDIFGAYRQNWRFNSLLYHVFRTQREIFQPIAEVAFFFGALLFAFQKAQSPRDTALRYYFAILLLYICAHSVHPWYVSWVLIAYPLLGVRYWAGLYLSAAAFLSYTAYWFEPAGERGWILILEYAPFYLLFLRDIYWFRREVEADNASKTVLREADSAG